jgi:hypothetical protein
MHNIDITASQKCENVYELESTELRKMKNLTCLLLRKCQKLFPRHIMQLVGLPRTEGSCEQNHNNHTEKLHTYTLAILWILKRLVTGHVRHTPTKL